MNKLIVKILKQILKVIWHCYAQNSTQFIQEYLKANDLVEELEAYEDNNIEGD